MVSPVLILEILRAYLVIADEDLHDLLGIARTRLGNSLGDPPDGRMLVRRCENI
jgi:hypothetical protein